MLRSRVVWAVLITYLVISLVPQMGLMALLGKRKRK
jgi:hypothetical protein